MKLSLVPWMAFKAQDELTYEWRQYQKLQDGDHVDHRCHSTHTQQHGENIRRGGKNQAKSIFVS